MSVLVDSCGWIEYLADGPLAEHYAPHLEVVAEVIVPTLVQYEVYKWVCREADERSGLRVAAQMAGGLVRALDSRTALLAADLSALHGLAMADAMIYAHARLDGASLLTSDAHFAGLAGVELRAKAASG